MSPVRATKVGILSGRAQQDLLLYRVHTVVHAIIPPQYANSDETASGGGIHVGPPKGFGSKANRDIYDFSFKLRLSKADDKMVEGILSAILGGTRQPFHPEIRDRYVTRAMTVARAFQQTNYAPPVKNPFSGGGIHVGPPKGKVKGGKAKRGALQGPPYDFSFKLALSDEDAERLKCVLHEMLGGEFVRFDPNGNEWPDPPRYR